MTEQEFEADQRKKRAERERYLKANPQNDSGPTGTLESKSLDIAGFIGSPSSSRIKTIGAPSKREQLKKSIAPAFGGNRAPSNPNQPNPEKNESALSEAAEEIRKSKKLEAKQKELDMQSEAMLDGASFMLDVYNANSAYKAYENANALQIQEARAAASDAIFRGKERAFQMTQQGNLLSEDVKVAMAAQGQDVSGPAVESIVDSYKTVAAYNAFKEETNGIREALGYQIQEVALDFELDQREIERDSKIISSALDFGTSTYGRKLKQEGLSDIVQELYGKGKK